MNKPELFKFSQPPRIFRREEKPLRPGEVGKSRIKEAIGLALLSSGLAGLVAGGQLRWHFGCKVNLFSS